MSQRPADVVTKCHLWSVPEVAKHLGVSRDSVYRLAGKVIPCYRVGGAVRFRPEEVEEYIEAQRVRRVAPAPTKAVKLEHLR